MDTSPVPIALQKRFYDCLKDWGVSCAVGVALLWIIPINIRSVILYSGFIIFLANILHNFVAKLNRKGKIQVKEKAVIISGCDSGFGYKLAQKLDDLGFQVFAGCLFPEGVQTLKKSSSDRLHVIKMDVTKDDDVQKAASYVREKLGKNNLWAVVNNAGILDGAETYWTSVETYKKVIDVNTLGVIRLTKEFLPDICKSNGRVVIVASAAGRYTSPCLVPYCMSKQAIISFSDGLRLEMGYRFGIEVITVEPSFFRTNLTSDRNVISCIRRTWEEAPDVVKKSYPDWFLQHYIKITLRLFNYSTKNQSIEVISCLEDAITARNPKYTYMPGTFTFKIALWFAQRFPKPFADYAIVKTFTALDK